MPRELEQGTQYEALINDRLRQADTIPQTIKEVQFIREQFNGSYTWDEIRDGKRSTITGDEQFERMLKGGQMGVLKELSDEGIVPESTKLPNIPQPSTLDTGRSYYDDPFFGDPL